MLLAGAACAGDAPPADGTAEDEVTGEAAGKTAASPEAAVEGPPGSRGMAARLRNLAEAVDPRRNLYENDLRVEALSRTPVPDDPRGRAVHRILVGEELLKAGRTEDAVRELTAARRAVEDPGLEAPPEIRRDVASLLAMAHLRRAERERCRASAGRVPCTLLLGDLVAGRPGGAGGPGGAGEPGTTGRPAGAADAASEAVELYEELLRADPDDLGTRWLLNLAAMLAGRYPEGIAGAARIPPAAFRAEEDIGRFAETAAEAGVDVVGRAGAAVLEDLDGDGDLDLLASARGLRDPLHLFLNRGDGTFEDATAGSGLEGLTGGANLKQADYDGDGHVDVLVLRGAWLPTGYPPSLLRNRGDGTFEDVTEAAGLLSLRPRQTADWADYDGDGDLDLFLGNETHGPETGGTGEPHPSELFRNEGDGTFTEVAASAGVDVVGFVKGVAWGDYDDDGDPDLYISRLREPNLLFRNDGPGEGGAGWRFTEVAEEAGVREPLASFPTWWWDYDDDGRLDLFVSGFGGRIGDVAAEYLGRPHRAERPRLYRNRGDGTFEDVTRAAGLNRVLLAMGANHGDLDGDGRPDLYGATGDPELEMKIPNRAFRAGPDGRFREITTSAGLGHLGKGHGVSFGDVDGDGDQDLHVVMGGAFSGDVERNVLFLNPGHGNRWLTLRLEGVEANRSAIGARIRVRVATEAGEEREIHVLAGSGGSFGANSLQQEIGLGRAARILLVEVRWPGSGRVDRWERVPLDAVVRLREGSPAPEVLGGGSPAP